MRRAPGHLLTIPPPRTFRKLQAQRGMPAQAKVGSWLGNNESANEPYESSDSGSSSTGSATEVEHLRKSGSRADQRADLDDGDDDEDEDSVEEQEEVDWTVVLPKIRPAMMDRSKKRRQVFIARYLAVTDQCTLLGRTVFLGSLALSSTSESDSGRCQQSSSRPSIYHHARSHRPSRSDLTRPRETGRGDARRRFKQARAGG